MKTIEEITFKIENGSYNRFKVYKYEEPAIRKIASPFKIDGKTELNETKIIITKYAIHRETECNGEFQEVLLCETECYSIVLKLLKEFIEEYISQIQKYII